MSINEFVNTKPSKNTNIFNLIGILKNNNTEKVQEMILKFKSMDFSISCYY